MPSLMNRLFDYNTAESKISNRSLLWILCNSIFENPLINRSRIAFLSECLANFCQNSEWGLMGSPVPTPLAPNVYSSDRRGW